MELSIEKEVQSALAVLRDGGVILYPTDTIWGLGCDASNPQAIQSLYEIKARDEDKPLLVLLDKKEHLDKYFSAIPRLGMMLMEEAVKPLTMIFPKARNLPQNLFAKDGSLGVRIVSHPFCTPLIEKMGTPLTSTSANFSGEKSPLNFHQINKELIRKVDFVVNHNLFDDSTKYASGIYKILNETKVICIRE